MAAFGNILVRRLKDSRALVALQHRRTRERPETWGNAPGRGIVPAFGAWHPRSAPGRTSLPQSRVTGRQIKAGRALLGWRRKDLAARCGSDEAGVRAAEADDGPHDAWQSVRERMAVALEGAGIEFTNGGALGVALRPRAQGLRTEDLNASNDD